MIYLMEHEVGYDETEIGFPSVSGCMAIALSTSNGLYGYHNPPAGTQGGDSQEERARRFKVFLDRKVLGVPQYLYGCTFRDNRRGYASPSPTNKHHFLEWMEEMDVFAEAIRYHGPISGVNLDRVLPGLSGMESSYVEYRRGSGGKCTILVGHWTQHSGITRAATHDPNVHFSHKTFKEVPFAKPVNSIDQSVESTLRDVTNMADTYR